MKLKFLRLIASLVLFFFSFHQLSFASPISIQPLAIDSKPNGFSNFINQLNPLAKIGIGSSTDGINLSGNLFKTFFGGAQQSAKSSLSNNGFFKLLGKVGEAISFQWLQNKIDKKIESSKMNSFLKSMLHTLTSIGTQALSAGVMALANAVIPGSGAFAKIGSVLGKLGSGLASVGRAALAGLKSAGSFLLNGVKSIGSAIANGFQALGRGISGAFSSAKSFFSNIAGKISGTRNAKINVPGEFEFGRNSASLFDNFGSAKISFGENVAWALDNSGDPYQLIRGPQNTFDFSKLNPATFRADIGEGNFTELRFNPDFDKTPTLKSIGNLSNNYQASFTKTQFDTDPTLSLLKDYIKQGAVPYNDFSFGNPSQLARISSSVIDTRFIDPNQKAWRTLDGFPKRVDQTGFMKSSLIAGMSFAGESPNGFDSLYDDGGWDFNSRDGRGLLLSKGNSIKGDALTAVAEIFADTQKAISVFRQQEIGTYQVVVQSYGTQNSTEAMRYFFLAGTHPDSDNMRTVMNRAYVENVILGMRRKWYE